MSMGVVRSPAEAGRFYMGEEKALVSQIEKCFLHEIGPGKLVDAGETGPRILGAVVPHAGFTFSGPVAAHVYRALVMGGFPKRFIVFGPNHTGMGGPVSLSAKAFRTPLGDVPNDPELFELLQGRGIPVDEDSHRFEHSIEVQLPFMQYVARQVGVEFSFVPIALKDQTQKTSVKMGSIIKDILARHPDVCVLASTDFSHYIPPEEAKQRDAIAVQKIIEKDVKGFYQVLKKHDVSMCGYGGTAALMTAMKDRTARLIKYATSGEVQRSTRVVGYGGIVFV